MHLRIHQIILFVALTSTVARTQFEVLDAYVANGLNENLTVRGAYLAEQKQQTKLLQANKLWKPSVDIAGTYLLAEGGRKINFPIGDLFNPTYATLNQLTGTNSFPTDLENVNTQLTPSNYIDAQFNISKPLINSSIKYNQLLQTALIELSKSDSKLTKEKVIVQIKTAYFNHLKSIEGQAVIDESRKLLDDVLAFNQKLIKYDKATKDVVADVTFQLENLQSQSVALEEQRVLSRSLFNLLINKELSANVVVDDAVLNFEMPLTIRPLTELNQVAKENRVELKQIEIAKGVNRINQERIDKEKSPQVAAFGGVGLQTESFQFDDGGPLATAGLSMSMNLYDGGRRKSRIDELIVDRNILDNNRLQLDQQIEIEVLSAYYGLSTAMAKYRASIAAENSGLISYNAIKARYENDKAILIELLQAESKLTVTRLEKALVKYDYLIKMAELEKAVGIKLNNKG